MPGADAKAASIAVETINELLSINNQFYSSMPSASHAVSQPVSPTTPWKTSLNAQTSRCTKQNAHITKGFGANWALLTGDRAVIAEISRLPANQP